jgi:hypothetical protein
MASGFPLDLDRKAPMMGAEVEIDYNAEVQK